MTLPPFPTDPQTLDLLDTAVRPGPHAERSSVGDFCTLVADMAGSNGEVVYHPNDVIAALVDEVRRLRTGRNPAQ